MNIDHEPNELNLEKTLKQEFSKSLLTEKIMKTIFWNKTGIQVLDALDEGESIFHTSLIMF